MKKRTTLTLLLVMAAVSVMFFTSCGGKEVTLESYVNDHPEIKENLAESIGASQFPGIVVDFSDNDMIVSLDLSGVEGITEEYIKAEETKQVILSLMDQQSDNLKGAANSMLEEFRKNDVPINKISIIVNYYYGDELIAGNTYESDPVSE